MLPAPQRFRHVALTGGLMVQFYWDAVPGAATYSLYVDGDEVTSGITSKASGPGWGARLQPGLAYRVECRAWDASGVGGAFSEPIMLTPTVKPYLGTQHIHVQMLTFTDVETPPISEQAVAGMFNALSNFYAKQSYGKFWYSFSISGWRNAPLTLAAYVQRRIETKPEWAPTPWQANGGLWYGIMQPMVAWPEMQEPFAPDAGNPDLTVWVVNGCGEVGFGDCYAARWLKVDTLMHECGHMLKLMHAGDIGWRFPETRSVPEDLTTDMDPRWAWSRYAHPGDPMGSGLMYPPQFCARHRMNLGWLPESASRVVIPGTAAYLTPVDAHPARGGARELRVDLGIKGVYFSIDYRADIDGVMVAIKHPIKGSPDTLINLVRPSTGPILKVGQSLVDDFRRLKITRTTSLLPGSARVKVERI